MIIEKPQIPEDNCIDLSDLDAAVYRVFSVERFVETLRTRRLTLTRPHLWDDPFENFLYQAHLESTDGSPVSVSGLRMRLYGQCWSLLDESDAMWRIYSPHKTGVKVRTTVRKLISAVYDRPDRFASLKYFIGRVSYKSEKELLAIFSNPTDYIAALTDASARGPVHALLLKRREFEHEKEVRLIYQSSEDVPDDYALCPIDPLALFDEVVFDPRMSIFSFEAFSTYIKAQGFIKSISRSRLYQLPEISRKIVI